MAALLAGMNVQAADSEFTFGGDVELDLNAINKSDSDDTIGHGGRVKLNAVGMIEGDGYFVKGVAQPLVPLKGNDLGYDDVFLQFGSNAWDVQLGRFEGIGVFGKGKDTLVENAGGIGVYEGNYARGRRDDVIHGAVNFAVSDAMKLQLGAMVDKQGSDTFTGVRPAISYSANGMSISAAVESVSDDISGVDKTGFGITGGVGLGAGTLGASFAKGTEDDGSNETDTTSASLHYTQGQWGVGYIHSEVDDGSAGGNPSVDTFHAAYTVPLFGTKNASVTFAASTSKADNVATDDTVNAARVRFNYAF
ncbi:MAG: carbohydrate porin [Thiolinea sp.]